VIVNILLQSYISSLRWCYPVQVQRVRLYAISANTFLCFAPRELIDKKVIQKVSFDYA